MTDAAADRNLLFGILAVQLGFVSQDSLIEGMKRWLLDKQRPFGDILRDQGHLSDDRIQLLTALVAEHLNQHDDDAQKSLAAISSIPPTLKQDLASLPDDDVRHTVEYIGSRPPTPPSRRSKTSRPQAASASPSPIRYRILRPHAKGGLGQVFVAEDTELGRPVALKEIQNRYADDAESRSRFVREAEITGGLEHPGIVPVYGLGTYADGRPFYAMRFIKGDNLREAVRRFHDGSPRFDSVELRELLRRFIDVCNAVAYAHSRGVLHRDLKPGNIMLGKYGETLVVDWGLAKPTGRSDAKASDPNADATLLPRSGGDASSETVAGEALGSPPYMSPEQAGGRWDELGPASDIYSLGATLYELLTADMPFPTGDLDAVQNGHFPAPRIKKPAVPPPLEAVCLKAMSLNPADRYASPLELAKDVEQWLADEPVSAWREPWSIRAWRWVRRHQKLTAAATALLVSGVIALTVSTVMIDQAQRETARALDREQDARRDVVAALHGSRVESATLALERGLTLGNGSDPAGAMLWFVRGLQLAPIDETPLRAVFLANLAAWRSRVNALASRYELRGSVNAFAISADGTTLLAGTNGGAWVCDLRSGQIIGDVLPHPGRVAAVAISPDGRTAVTDCGVDDKIRLWDLQTRQFVDKSIAFSGQPAFERFRPDGKVVAVAHTNGDVLLWDINSAAQIGETIHNAGGVTVMSFRPDGNRLLTIGQKDRMVRQWDPTTGAVVGRAFQHPQFVSSVAWSTDGRHVLLGDLSHKAQLWDLETGKPTGQEREFQSMVLGVAMSPDGKMAAAAGDDGTVSAWSLSNDDLTSWSIKHPAGVKAIAFSHDGKKLVTGCNDFNVRVWEIALRTDAAIRAEKDPTAMRLTVAKQAIRSDGNVVAFGSLRGTVQFIDADTGQPVGPLRQAGGPAVGLAFSADGKKLFVGCLNKSAGLYDVDTWTLAGPAITAAGAIQQVAISSDSKRLMTASQVTHFRDHTGENQPSSSSAGVVEIWDAVSGKAARPSLETPEHIDSLACSPKGDTVVAGGVDGKARVWNGFDGTLLNEIAHDGPVTAAAISGRDARIATGAGSGTARVWDLATFKPKTPLLRHSNVVTQVAFSPDGRLTATASWDATLRVWDIATGKPVGPIQRHANPVNSMAFAADGKTIVSVDQKDFIRKTRVQAPVADDLQRLSLWVESMTGLELEPDGGVRYLPMAEWRERSDKLATLGGPLAP
jgi:WD40 repeat protein/serine/threonine protein kinase